jgi:hypothetical protein
VTWVAAAVVGGAVIGGIATNKAAKKAGDAQSNASSDAIDFQRESRDLALGLQAPYRDASYAATAALMDLTGLSRTATARSKPLDFSQWLAQQPGEDIAPQKKKKKGGLFGGGVLGALLAPSPKDFLRGQVDPAGAIKSAINGKTVTVTPDLQAKYQEYTKGFDTGPDLSSYPKYEFTTDPGYQFRLGEGNKALEHSLVARSGALSGAGAKSALRYAQNYASNEYQNVYNRIASIAGFGQNATNASTNVIQNTGTNVGNAILNAGDARASSYVAQGNSWSNAINQASMAGGFYFGNRTGFGA